MEEIKFIRELTDIKITKAKTSATFECEISKSGLKLEWFKGTKKLRRDEKYTMETDDKVHRLVVDSVTQEDLAQYSATYEKLSTAAKLDMAVAPCFGHHDYKDRIVLRAGTSTVLEIPFTGCPAPEAEWKFKGSRLPDARRFKVDTIVNMTSLSMAKVVRSDAGKYTLDLSNDHGKATFTITVVVLDKPGPVENLKTTAITENSVSLKWEDPEDDGGCMITEYVIEKREVAKRTWERDGTNEETEHTSIALTEGSSYNFRVAAVNEVGTGPFTELPKAVIPKSQFDPPGPPSAPEPSDITKESCVLTWRPPTEDGGSPVTGYFIERAAADSTRWLRVTREPISETKHKVTDLIEDNKYKFRIVAVNKVGEGPPGPESGPVHAKDPWDKPGKPDPPNIGKITKTTVALTWKPPRDDGGAEIFNYVLEYRVENGFKWVRASSETVSELNFVVKGLTEGTIYEFRVAAENKAGVGPASDPTAPVEAREVIIGSPPKILEDLMDMLVVTPEEAHLECDIDLGDPKATLHWYKESKEVYDSKKYSISYKNETATLHIKETSVTDSGWYRCEAENKLGRVQTECTLTVESAPILEYDDKLKETSIKAGNSLILLVDILGCPTPRVKWLCGETEVYAGDGVTIEGDGTFSRLTIKGARGTHSGKYTIVAENKVGKAEAEFNCKIIDVPTVPVNLKVKEIYKDYIVMTWEAPKDDGGSPITGYTIEKKDTRKTSFMSAGSTDGSTYEFKITKLVEGNEYDIQVCAVNAIGDGPFAKTDEPVKARLPFDPPGPPKNVKANDVTKTSCTITWSEPEFDGGSPIKGYYVEKLSGTRWIKVNKKSTTRMSMTIDDLIEGSECEYRVCAENEAGIGKPSDTTGRFIAKDPYDLPGRPDAPEVEEMTKDSAVVNWKPPRDDGGAKITSYVLEIKGGSNYSWTVVNKKVSELTFTVTGLQEETDYEFRVAAENKAGVGQPSPPSKPSKYGKIIDIKLIIVKSFLIIICK